MNINDLMRQNLKLNLEDKLVSQAFEYLSNEQRTPPEELKSLSIQDWVMLDCLLVSLAQERQELPLH